MQSVPKAVPQHVCTMTFYSLSNEIVNQIFSYFIQEFLSVETRKERSVLEYRNVYSYAAVCRE